jgi:LysM domain
VPLSKHLTASAVDHGRLGFHPDCPRCRVDRLAGPVRRDALVSRRAQAAFAAGLLAFSVGAAPASAQVPEVDSEQQAAPAPGGEPPGLQPDLDPGEADTFDYETAPVPGGPGAGGEEDEGPGAPVDSDPTIDPDVPLPPEEQAPAPAPPAPSTPAPAAPAPEAAPVPAPAPAPPPAAPVPPPASAPAAGAERPAPPPPLPGELREYPKQRGGASKVRAVRIGVEPIPPALHGGARPTGVGYVALQPADSVPTAGASAEAVPVSQQVSASESRIDGGSYVVQPGDSLWSIGERLLGPGASAAEIADEVNRLWELNKDRIATGDPDLLPVGTELRL